MTKRAAFYLRVSTDGQTVENQERDLREVAERSGWVVTRVYKDEGISGRKGRDKRPAFDALLKATVRREHEIVAAWAVDRLGRSLQDLLAALGEIRAAGADLYLHKQSLDTSTPAGNAMFQMLGVFAEFEASIIHQRVMAGLTRAWAAGKKSGRRQVSAEREAAVRAELARGSGVLKTARTCGVGVSVVQRVKRAGL